MGLVGYEGSTQNVLYLLAAFPTPECQFLTTAFDEGQKKSERKYRAPEGEDETTSLALNDTLMQP